MPKVIIINIPMMYHCVLHVQSMSLTSVASTALIHCIAMFVTKAFNLRLHTQNAMQIHDDIAANLHCIRLTHCR